jgi:ABC-type glycerol-3-phosphate transport system permease component
MTRSKRRRSLPKGAGVAYTVLGLALLFALVPVYWMITLAFKSSGEIALLSPTLFPHRPTFAQFDAVLQDGTLARSVMTSAVLAVLTALVVVVVGSAAAYVVTHWAFRGARSFLVLTLFTQLLPQSAVVVPVYLLWNRFGLTGSGAGLGLIYISLFLPVSVWMLTGYFQSIPVELTEAGRVDGASRLRILFSIILPVARPALAAAAIYTALACWSEFLLALVLLTGDTRTVTITLAGLIGQHSTDVGQLMAASTVATLPPLVAFFLLQRYFVSGLTVGSVKG